MGGNSTTWILLKKGESPSISKCCRGHIRTEENTVLYYSNGNQYKRCKDCISVLGKQYNRTTRKSKVGLGEPRKCILALGDKFSCGHERSFENTLKLKDNRNGTCRTCNLEWQEKRRRAKGMKEQPVQTKESRRISVIKAAQTRRARKKEAFVEVVDPRVLYERDGGFCYLCDKFVHMNNMHIEHVIPLSKGGEHSYANTKIAHPLCNMKKGSKIIELED